MAKQNINVTLQKMASKTAKQLQKMVNSANKEALAFNAAEAKKVRDYNSLEATTARNFNASQATLERDFNSAEAQKSRDWQERMSNTAHQREVVDLRKAGLNPVLSANTGAQSYTTSSASAGSASANNASASNASGTVDSGANVIASLMSSLMGSMANIANTKASAQASLDAAKISGAYNLKAAETSASAQRYVADKNYDAKMDQPQTSIYGLVDKYLGKAGQDLEKSAYNLSWNNLTYNGKTNSKTYHVNGDYTWEQKQVMNAGLIKIGYNRNYLDSLSKKKQLQLYDAYFAGVVKKNEYALANLRDKTVFTSTKFKGY